MNIRAVDTRAPVVANVPTGMIARKHKARSSPVEDGRSQGRHDVARSPPSSGRRSLDVYRVEKGKLLGGGLQVGDNTGAALEERPKRLKKDRKSVTPTEEPDVKKEDMPKIKAAVKKYEMTVCKLVSKMNLDQKEYARHVAELQETNDMLRNELMSITETYHQIMAQLDGEQESIAQLKGDHSNILEKNAQLEADLAKMVENLQHSNNLLTEMQQKDAEKEGELMNLTKEKNYLVQQVDDMRRLSRSIDSFAPGGEGRRASACSAFGDCCNNGLLGWLFGHGKGATTRMFIFGFLLCLALGYFFQNLRPAQAGNPIECDYETEMFPEIE